MKSVVALYKEVGKRGKTFMGKKSRSALAGTEPPIWQTPGKLQYYKAEMEPYVPDEIKWQLRLPTRFAERELKLTYLQQVQEETINFLNERIKYDYLKPERELSLDLTLNEAEILISANQDIRDLAEKGDLKKLHSNYQQWKDKVESEYLIVREHVQKILHQIEEKENDVYTQLEELGIENIRKNGQKSSLFDALSLSTGDSSFENLALVDGAIIKGHEASDQLRVIQDKLRSYIGIKAKYYEIKVHLREEYIKKVVLKDAVLEEELRQMVDLRDKYAAAYDKNPSKTEEYEVYLKSIESIRNDQVKNVLNDFNQYEAAYNERQRFYHHYMKEQTSEALDTFRTELLQHLAGSIVVKEHRQRYQKEQFDRFISSLMYNALRNKNQDLRQFCVDYADMIESLIDESHNFRSPKIEANYDDFSERTIRPLNATIFYYFFSADRRKRTFAQWLLSTVRYPNDRVRRAYTRFFA